MDGLSILFASVYSYAMNLVLDLYITIENIFIYELIVQSIKFIHEILLDDVSTPFLPFGSQINPLWN